MAYSDFTIPELKKRFHLSVDEQTSLFDDIPEVELPATLALPNVSSPPPRRFNKARSSKAPLGLRLTAPGR
jgi:hypothetical protein